jgi:EmrB/QacA subfamily drug resistance transporter
MPRLTAENRKWWILATMTGSLSMILLDETVVGVALPTIQRDLHMTQNGLQWVVNAYLLALASFVAIGGRLSELLGQARMFRLGALVFVAASAACGLAQSESWIIAARALQGLGAAMMIPPTTATVINAFTATERGRAMGIYGGISMISLALGPLVGGVLTQSVTWRAVFWVNLPVGLAMLALAAISLPADRPEPEARMDWRGAFTLVPGVVMIVLALMQAQQWGWGSSATVALLCGGTALVAAFTFVELRTRSPLVQLKLFRSRNFSVDNTVLALIQFALTGLTVFGALYVQELLGFGPITAGLSFLPVVLPLLLLAPRAGVLYDRIGPRTLVATGAALLGASLVWIAIMLGKLEYAWLLPAYVVAGIGMALVMTPASTDAMNSAPATHRGQASGVMNTLKQVGGTVGLAIMGTAVTTVQHDRLTDYANRVGASAADRAHFTSLVAAAHGDPSLLHNLPSATLGALSDSLVSAIGTAYLIAGAAVLIGAVVSALLLRRVRAADATPRRAASVAVAPAARPAPAAQESA